MDAKDTLKNPREMSRLLFGLLALERDLKASLRHAWELHEHGHLSQDLWDSVGAVFLMIEAEHKRVLSELGPIGAGLGVSRVH